MKLVLDEPVKKTRLVLDEPKLVLDKPAGEPIGFMENIQRGGVLGFAKKLPFSPYGLAEQADLLGSMKRLQEDDYEKYQLAPKYQMMPMGGYTRTFQDVFTKERDTKVLEDYFDNLEEESRRGKTFWAKVGSGISILPAWMLEFAATGGLANIGRKATKEFAEKLVKKQTAARLAGWLGGAAARTAAMPHRVGEAVLGRQVKEPEEGWATSIAKGWGEVFIEAASEEAGQAITGGLAKAAKKLPFGGKLLGALDKAWRKIRPTKSSAEFLKQISTKAGYSNFIGEVGEERLATIMHAIADTEDFGAGKDSNVLERLQAGIRSDIENLPVEAVVLATPGAARFAVAKGIDIAKEPQIDAAKFARQTKWDEAMTKGEMGIVEEEPEVVEAAPVAVKPEIEPAPPKAPEAFRDLQGQISRLEDKVMKVAPPGFLLKVQHQASQMQMTDEQYIDALQEAVDKIEAKVAPKAPEGKLDKLQEMIKKHPGTLTVAVKLDSGEIISDPKVGNHGELLDKYNLDLNKVADGGFVVGGEYISSITDAKRPSPEVIAKEQALAPAEGKVDNKAINKALALDTAEIKPILVRGKGQVYRTYIKDFEGNKKLVGEFGSLTEARQAIIPAQEAQLKRLREKKAQPPAAKERPKDLLGRPELQGGALGKQREFLDKEDYRKPEPDIEGQMTILREEAKETEEGIEEWALETTGISNKDRKKRTKAIEKQISEHPIYQLEIDAAEDITTRLPVKTYAIGANKKGKMPGEIADYIGKPGEEGYKGYLRPYVKLVKPGGFVKARGTSLMWWDDLMDDLGEHPDMSRFIELLDQAVRAEKSMARKFNEGVFEKALESQDVGLQLLDSIRYGLQSGLPISKINQNIMEFAEDLGLTEEDVSDLIIPEYTDEQRAKAIKAARQKDRKLEVAERTRLAEKERRGKAEQARLKELIEREKTARMEKQVAAQRMQQLQKQSDKIAKEKGLMSARGKPTQNYSRFAKAMTGKTRIEKMTPEEAEHFIDMLEALTVGYQGRAKIPTSKHLITKELSDKIGKFTDIGFAERFRPAWRVFEKIGISKEIFDPTLESEIKSTEELFAFREKAAELQKLVGTDKTTSRRLFLAMENPGKIKLNENEQKVIKWAQQFFRDWARRLHLSSEKQRKNYITHIFEREITEDLKKKYPLDPDLIKALEFITPKTVFNPYLQKRLGKKIGLKEDFWSALQAYEGRALKTFYYEPLIKRLRVYQKFLPPNAARYLRNYIARITNRPTIVDREVNQSLKEAAREIEKLPGGKQIAKYLQRGNASGMLAYNMTGVYYECWLGLRPASAIKNLSQHGLILCETGPIAFTKALATTGKKRAALLERSLVLRSRKLGYLPGIDQTFIKSLESKRRKITMAMFRTADRKNVSDAFLAGYHEAKAKGLPNEWAYKRGDEVARKTQWLYNKMAGSQFTQTAPGRVLGVLTTWPINWGELVVGDWAKKGNPSQIYNDYQKATGNKVAPTNWFARRKALWTYLALVSLAFLIQKKTPFKAIYYTGWTSLRSLADMARGELAGLNIPGIIADLTAGVLTGDKRRIKRAWNEIKRFPVIVRELKDIITGKKDWMNLFLYMERKKEKGGRPTRPSRPSR